jgi:hypothetical protein
MEVESQEELVRYRYGGRISGVGGIDLEVDKSDNTKVSIWRSKS